MVSDQNTQHSAESNFENVIQETRKPFNQFKQQMLIATGRYTIHEMVNIFGNTRHIIEFDTPENLVPILREYIPEDRALIIEKTYSRAHRGLDENYKLLAKFQQKTPGVHKELYHL